MAHFVRWYAPYVSPAIGTIPEQKKRFEAMRSELVEGFLAEWDAAGKDRFSTKTRRELGPYSPRELPFITMLEGWRWPSYDEPLRDEARTRPKKLKDIICSTFGYAISQRAIDVIETLEPGVHQFLPFELVDGRGNRLEDERRLLNVCSRIQAIDVERSGSNLIDNGGQTIHPTGPGAMVMSREKMAGRHLWYEWRFIHAGVVVSDQLWAALKKAKITGWASHRQHIPEI